MCLCNTVRKSAWGTSLVVETGRRGAKTLEQRCVVVVLSEDGNRLCVYVSTVIGW